MEQYSKFFQKFEYSSVVCRQSWPNQWMPAKSSQSMIRSKLQSIRWACTYCCTNCSAQAAACTHCWYRLKDELWIMKSTRTLASADPHSKFDSLWFDSRNNCLASSTLDWRGNRFRSFAPTARRMRPVRRPKPMSNAFNRSNDVSRNARELRRIITAGRTVGDVRSASAGSSASSTNPRWVSVVSFASICGKSLVSLSLKLVLSSSVSFLLNRRAFDSKSDNVPGPAMAAASCCFCTNSNHFVTICASFHVPSRRCNALWFRNSTLGVAFVLFTFKCGNCCRTSCSPFAFM